MHDEKKIGVVISYINIVLNMIVSVFFTPFLISSLGTSEYGVYKIVQSFSGQLMIMTFGIGALVTRNIVYFDECNQKKEKENFLAMAVTISFILAVIVALIGSVLYGFTDSIFSGSLTAAETDLAKKLIVFLIINVALTVFNDGISGIAPGHDKFAVYNGIKTIRLILRILTLVILLVAGFKSIAIVLTDLCLTVCVIIFNIIYGFVILGERAHFYYFDKILFKSSMSFSAAVLLQGIVNQVNQGVDNIILGVMTDSRTVAVYSVALTIYSAYNGIATVIMNMLLPSATRMIVKKALPIELTDFVSRMGRYQFIIAGAVIVGFVLLGKEFLLLWLGVEYLPVYKIVLILIIPMTIPLIQGSCNAILDAELRRLARSIILSSMVVVNIIASVIFISKFGYIGAAYGTSLSVILGHIIALNIYYKKCLKLNIIKMFTDIFRGILPAMMVSGLGLYVIFRIVSVETSWVIFSIKLLVFILTYVSAVFYIGMNKIEKSMVRNMINKVISRLKR